MTNAVNPVLVPLLESIPEDWTPASEIGEWSHLDELWQGGHIECRIVDLGFRGCRHEYRRLRRGATCEDGWPTTMRLYPGIQTSLPRVGERVSIRNFKDGSEREGKVIELHRDTHEYTVSLARPPLM
jgi:hypothetical protein